MSTRSAKRPPVLNNIESLLLAQSVWDLGASQSTWSPIAKILSKHPLLSRPKPFFTAQSCHSMYAALMKDAGLDLNESTAVPHAAGVNLQLAQKHFRSRFLELQGLILNEETKFKAVLKEIEEIRAGLWDKQEPNVEAKSSAQSPTQSQASPQQTQVHSPLNSHLSRLNELQIADEIFSGSDLSGVTDSADSAPSQSQPERDAVDSPIATHQDIQMDDVAPSAENQENLEEQQPSTDARSPSTPKHQPKDITDEVGEAIVSTPEQVAMENTPTAETITKSVRQSPIDIEEENISAKTSVKHDKTEDRELSQVPIAVQDEDLFTHTKRLDQRQEEEEDEVTQEEKNEEEEEEEASQGQEDSEMLEEARSKHESESDEIKLSQKENEGETAGHPEDNVDADQQTEKEPSSPKSIHDTDIASDLEPEPVHSPVAQIVGSEVEPTQDDGQSSEVEEPVAPARRSSRRRKSSAASVPPLQTRTRLRSKARASENELQATAAIESDNDDDLDVKEDTPQMEEERTSSPFEGAMTRRREGKRKASFLESTGSPHDKKRLREDSEPVDEEEPGPSLHNPRTRITRNATRTEEQLAMKRFQSVIGMLHSQISQHRNGNIFHNPIKNSEAPDYHEIVKRPMDLKTIKTRVKDGVIANSLEFQRDIYLMFANAMMYNRPGSDVHAMAEDMMLESEGQINAFRQTEGLVKRGQRP